MRYLQIISLLLVISLQCYGQTDTIKIYFNLGSYQLTNDATQLLDSLAYNNSLSANSKYGIIGYTDYLGTDTSNITLSQKRAITVQQYLQGLGIGKENLTAVTGKGAIERDTKTEEGNPVDRRVDIIPGDFEEPNKLDVRKLKQNETFQLKNIMFIPGMATLRKTSMPTLESLYELMSENRGLNIQIEGHVHDWFGYDTLNHNTESDAGKRILKNDYELSYDRAKAIYTYLIEKGIKSYRVKYVGLSNAGMKEHPEDNRRVEIRILKK